MVRGILSITHLLVLRGGGIPVVAAVTLKCLYSSSGLSRIRVSTRIASLLVRCFSDIRD